MNVLMLSDVFFPRINGVSTSIDTFRGSLPQYGIESTLIAPAYPATWQDDARTVRIPSRYLPLDPEDRIMQRGQIRKLLPQLRALAPGVVHIQTPFIAHYAGIELSQALGVPCMATYHTFFEEYLYHYVPFAPRAWMKAAARRFSRTQCNDLDAIIVPSTAMRDALLQYGVTRPMHVLPTGIPSSGFHGGDGGYFRERYGIPADRKILLFVGRVAHEKNIGLLLNMMVELHRSQPDAVLVVTGEGPALSSLREQCKRLRLQDHVRFLGYLDRSQALHDCYRAADLFVFASRTETQGLVLLESMALGTPVVAVAEMGTRDILGPEKGCRIAPCDPAGFAAVVDAVLRAPELRNRLAQEAHDYARTWSADAMAERMAGIYRSLAPESATAAAATPANLRSAA